MFDIGEKYLITTDNFFVAPDGQQYNSVFGTVKDIKSSEDTLGIKTNMRSTNWYIIIGNMLIAGCQIHYVIKTDEASEYNCNIRDIEHQGKLIGCAESNPRIYIADK